jgi:gas vesicle protein
MADRDWGTFGVAFIVGLGIGAALGIILAPKSGEDVRGDLSEAARNVIDQGAAVGEKVSRRARRAVNDAAEQVTDAIVAGRREFERAKSQQA